MGILEALSDLGVAPTVADSPGVMRGPCPLCGGHDRFAAWVERGTFYCRRCGIKGNFRRFFEVVHGLGAEEAAAKARAYGVSGLGGEDNHADPNEIVDRDEWLRVVRDLIEFAEAELAGDEDALAYLRDERGLDSDTIRRYRLGLLREDEFFWRDQAGLKPYSKPDGRTVWRVFLPAGILIPGYAPGVVGPASLVVRAWDGAQGRYRAMPGSALSPMVIEGEQGAHAGVLFVVENVFCGIKLHLDTGVGVVALWGVHTPLSEQAAAAIGAAGVVLVATDNDEAGMAAAESYEAAYPNAVFSPVPSTSGKDITDAWRAGLDLNKYVAAAVRRARRVLKGQRTTLAPQPIPAQDTAVDTSETVPVATRNAPEGRPASAMDDGRPSRRKAPAIEITKGASVPGLRPRSYRYVTDAAEAAEAVARLAAENDTVAIDIETAKLPEHCRHPKAGLDPHLSQIRLVQLCGRRGDALIIDCFACGKDLRGILKPLLDRRMVAHNAVFEMKHLGHAGRRLGTLECTRLMWYALTNETHKMRDPDDAKSMALSLTSGLRRATGVEIPKTQQTSDWGREELTPDQLTYAANDVLHLVRLHDTLLNRLRMARLEPVYARLRGAQRAVVELERGMCFDTARHAEMIDRWRAEAGPLEHQVREAMGGEINLNSNPQLDAFLRSMLPEDRIEAWPKTPSGLLSTAGDALVSNADLDFLDPLLRLWGLKKLISTYGEKMASFVNPVTGRLAPDFHLAGAVTGRMSSSRPSFQNLPRGDFRAAFLADPGDGVVVSADYSQIELRVAALLAKDRELLKGYSDGVDIHRQTAAMVFGVGMDAVTKEQRQMAKAISFGTLFGQGGEGLRSYARGFGVEMTVGEAKQFQKKLFEAYPQLRRWQDKIREAARWKAPVRTKGGRVRRFGEGEERAHTRSLNTPVQGTASEILLRALTLVAEALEPLEARLVNTVHDEIVATCGEDHSDAVAGVLRECMTQAFLEMFPGAPTLNLVECGVGRNWAEAK